VGLLKQKVTVPMKNSITSTLMFTMGLLLGGMFMWMIDYAVYYDALKQIMRACGNAYE
jgi:hypothetical protein